MRTVFPFLLVLLLSLLGEGTARAFCGFFVSKADSKLFNRASRVVLARSGDRTVITMANDYRGELEEFALVVPVPTFLEREQIHVAEPALVDHLDAFTAPRLVEYHDPNPCAPPMRPAPRARVWESAARADGAGEPSDSSLGVTVEAEYTVGEYDILILSAEESEGLETWLRRNGYRIPRGASRVLSGYIRTGMRFFVAKVNLDEQSRLGYSYLRPLQVAYESPRFMLPIRLGMVNADGPQELFVYTLTERGRVESTNYRTVKLPTGMDLPVFVKDEFADFYRDMFSRQVEEQSMRTVFLEYAWDMGWCDPCAADPLTSDELRELGVFWLAPKRNPDVFVTRLHVRYDEESFPEDLVFQETGDRTNFQGRYVLRHAWDGPATCPAAERYRDELSRRWEREARTLAVLTGWELTEIRDRMGLDGVAAEEKKSWWERIWGE